mmetsp:Transcript_584/g.821  ORF Transcript_584/g.821 Transcript_584/m.821 type:complete len:450 (+) Transcript_584:140-1489(+)
MSKKSSAGIYLARWPNESCRIDLLTATSKNDVLSQLDEIADTSGVQVIPYHGPISFSLTPKLATRWKSKDYIKVSESKMGSQFETLLKRKDLTDFTIRSKNGKSGIQVHKLVLIARSSFFDQLFSNSNISSYTFENFTHDAVTAYINYLYSDKLNHIENQLCFEVLKLANFTKEQRLMELLEQRIDQKWDNYGLEKLVSTAKRAYENNATQLKKATSWLLANTLDPSKAYQTEPDFAAFQAEWEQCKTTHPQLAKDVESLLNGFDPSESNNNNNASSKKRKTRSNESNSNKSSSNNSKKNNSNNNNSKEVKTVDYFDLEVGEIPDEILEWNVQAADTDTGISMLEEICAKFLPEFHEKDLTSMEQEEYEAIVRKTMKPALEERARKLQFRLQNKDSTDPTIQMMKLLGITSAESFSAFLQNAPGSFFDDDEDEDEELDDDEEFDSDEDD